MHEHHPITGPVCGMTVKPKSSHRSNHADREPALAGRRRARVGYLIVRKSGVVILAAGHRAFGHQHAAA